MIEQFYKELNRHYAAGNIDAVEQFLHKSGRHYRPCCGGFNPIYLAVLSELGSFYRGTSRYAASVEAFTAAGRIIEEFIGPESVEYATNINNLAGTYRLMGENDKSINLFNQAFEIYRTTIGTDNYLYASALNNAGLLYQSIADFEKAIDCLEQALAILNQLGAFGENVATTYSNLAVAYEKTGRYDQAQEALRQALERFASLPGSFLGFPERSKSELSVDRVGVMATSSFYYRYIGLRQAPRTLMEWRRIPESYLAVVTNGEVFVDEWGEFSKIRSELMAFYPEDIRIKKIVSRAAIMAQAGQYNYARCIKRREYVAAQCALHEFTTAAFSMLYLLNRKYAPFYKWAHRGIRRLPVLSETYDLFSALCRDYGGEDVYRMREDIIETICTLVIEELKRQKLTDLDDVYLQNHCCAMMQRIEDDDIRKLHILAE